MPQTLIEHNDPTSITNINSVGSFNNLTGYFSFILTHNKLKKNEKKKGFRSYLKL